MNKKCNFDCVYCEVDRIHPPRRLDIDLRQLEAEMKALLDLAVSGKIYEIFPFDSAKKEQQRLNDLAFSGDGEPTTAPEFPDTVEILAKLLKKYNLADVKLVLITNATKLNDATVIKGVDTLMLNNGEIWAKLDAGTEAQYLAINRSDISLMQILKSLEFAGNRWPIFIQTLFLEWNGTAPSELEISVYLGHIKSLLDKNIKLKGLQLHTVARPTPESGAKPLSADAMHKIVNFVNNELPNINVEIFFGHAV